MWNEVISTSSLAYYRETGFTSFSIDALVEAGYLFAVDSYGNAPKGMVEILGPTEIRFEVLKTRPMKKSIKLRAFKIEDSLAANVECLCFFGYDQKQINDLFKEASVNGPYSGLTFSVSNSKVRVFRNGKLVSMTNI